MSSDRTVAMVAEWTGPRAPAVIPLRLAGIRIRWRPDPCAFPISGKHLMCPDVRKTGSDCPRTKDATTCSYDCGKIDPGATTQHAFDLPLAIDLTFDAAKMTYLREPLTWSASVGSVGETLVGVPEGTEHVEIEFQDGPRDVFDEPEHVVSGIDTSPSKRERQRRQREKMRARRQRGLERGFPKSENGHVLLSMIDQHGQVRDISITKKQITDKRAWMEMPGVRCQDSLRYSYSGRREYVDGETRMMPPDGASPGMNRARMRPPRRMARRLGVIIGAGAGGVLPFPTGDRAHGLSLELSGGATDTLDVPAAAVGRFEGALSFWPARPLRKKDEEQRKQDADQGKRRGFAYAFELGAGAFLMNQGYFTLDTSLHPDAEAKKSLRSFVLGEASMIMWRGGRWAAGEVGFGVGRSFASRRKDQGLSGEGRTIGGVHTGVRILNAPHGVLAVRGHLIAEPGGVRWFSTDARGAPIAESRTALALLLTVVARFDVTQVPGLLQDRGARRRGLSQPSK